MLSVDKIASNLSGNILHQEVDFYLNTANVAIAREAWIQKDQETYRPLHVVSALAVAPSAAWVGAGFAVTPGALMLAADAHQVNYPQKGGYTATLTVDRFFLQTLPTVTNPYPLTRKALVVLAGTQVLVSPCPDDPTVIADQISLSFLRRPADISLVSGVTSELPPHVHQKIIERAVSLALTDLKTVRPANDNPTAS